MKILFITQTIDLRDDNRGFVHRWIEKLSQRVDEIHVVCLQQGSYSFSSNVRVHSLGKEKFYKLNRFLRRLIVVFNLERIVLPLLFKRKVDVVLLHMTPQYVFFIWPFLKIFRKPAVLFKTHKKASFLLRMSVPFFDEILTATARSFPIKTKKVMVIGHGIDTELFKPQTSFVSQGTKTILTIGRITPIKNIQALIRAIDVLVNQKKITNINVKIVGGADTPSEKRYLFFLKKEIEKRQLKEYIDLLPPVPYHETVKHYQQCDLFCNFCTTGGLDKTTLEAMACGKLICTSQENLAPYLGRYKGELMVDAENSQEAASKIEQILFLSEEAKQQISSDLREVIIKYHSLSNFINSLVNELRTLLNYES